MGGCCIDYMIRKGIPRFVNSSSKKVVPCGTTFSQGYFKSEIVASCTTGVRQV